MKEIQAFVGIDLAKDSSRVAIIDSQGKEISPCFSITNSKDGMEKLLDRVSHLAPDQVAIGMEVSSNYWENVYSLLKEKGYCPVLLNPYQIRKYSQALGEKIKTDSVDASLIAKIINNGDHESICLTSEDAITLRELVRTRHSFDSRIKDLKKSVLAMLGLVFPEYTKLISHPFSKVSMEILSKYPTAVHMAEQTSVSRLLKIFRKYQGCNFTKDKAKELIDAARDSFYSGRASSARGMTLSMQIDEITGLEKKVAAIEAEIKSILAPDDRNGNSSSYEILNSIKGVGIGTIATFLAFAGDVSRFETADKFISYVGFYPKIHESGKYKRINPCIQKAGPKELRHMLYMASVACVKHNRELKKYYFDKLSAGMPAKKALIKVAAKLARMMYSMIKNKSYYDSERVLFQSGNAVFATA